MRFACIAIASCLHLTGTIAPVSTNLPLFKWTSSVPRTCNTSAVQVQVRETDSLKSTWDSGWMWRLNPHDQNATTWPLAAVTYGGPALRPSSNYTWQVREQDCQSKRMRWRKGGFFSTSVSLPSAAEEAWQQLMSENISRLYHGQLDNLLARVSADGYVSTSVYGGYSGLYTRDTSAFVIAMVRLGSKDSRAMDAARAALSYMLRTFSMPGLKDHTNNSVVTLDRAPHCTWSFARRDAPLDFCPSFDVNRSSSCVVGLNCTCFATSNYSQEPFHDQVDGTAHLILAYGSYCKAAHTGEELAAQYYPLMKRFLATYVGDGVTPASGPYFDEGLGLIWNPGFEGPGGSNYNLLTCFLIAEALGVMSEQARKMRDTVAESHWTRIRARLLIGIETNLTASVDDMAVYAQYRDHDSALTLKVGFSWVNFGPIAMLMASLRPGRMLLDCEKLNCARMRSTLAAVRRFASFEWGPRRAFAEASAGVVEDALAAGLPLAEVVYPGFVEAQFAAIGKGIGWELGWAALTQDWQRVTAVLRWLARVAGDVGVRCMGSPCSQNSSAMFGESYFYTQYLDGQWYFADIGNAEQASWFLLGVDLVREALRTSRVDLKRSEAKKAVAEYDDKYVKADAKTSEEGDAWSKRQQAKAEPNQEAFDRIRKILEEARR